MYILVAVPLCMFFSYIYVTEKHTLYVYVTEKHTQWYSERTTIKDQKGRFQVANVLLCKLSIQMQM
jgi:hypothetical protein